MGSLSVVRIDRFLHAGRRAALVLVVLRRADGARIERGRIARRKTVAQLIVNLLFFVLWFSVGAEMLRFHVLFLSRSLSATPPSSVKFRGIEQRMEMGV